MWAELGLQILGAMALVVGGWSLVQHIRRERAYARRALVANAWKAAR